MSDGLKRASAAAARTRWDGTLTLEMYTFLAELRRRGGSARPPAMERWASSAASAARQRCKRLGLVDLSLDEMGRQLWALRPAGMATLAQTDARRTEG